MDNENTGGHGEIGWANASACTLPTAQRPLRIVAFDDLFRSSLRSITRASDSSVRLLLAGDSDLAGRTQRLADAESSCCSFFTFRVTTPQPGVVEVDIDVPPAYANVLVGLVERAEAVMGGAA